MNQKVENYKKLNIFIFLFNGDIVKDHKKKTTLRKLKDLINKKLSNEQ
jgi:hypothetical protein